MPLSVLQAFVKKANIHGPVACWLLCQGRGYSYFSLLDMTAIPGRKEIKPVYHLSTHPTRFSPAAGEKREKKLNMQVESLDVVFAQRSQKLHLLEGTRCLFHTHEQQGSGGKAGCAARSELLPGSHGQVSVPVSRWQCPGCDG